MTHPFVIPSLRGIVEDVDRANHAPVTDELTSTLALPWILRLRYGLAATEGAIVALAIVVARAHAPLLPAAVVIAITALSNRFQSHLQRALKIPIDKMIAGLFCLDILCLTAIFMLTGGATNPFSLLYLVQITLSAAILSKRWTWFLGVLAIFCFGSLFVFYVPIPLLEMHHYHAGLDLHLMGMWIGFTVAAFLIALFSGKISEALREREKRLLLLQQQLAAKEKLASLATLAAGAAHELSTPLATIAVVAKELENFATRTELNSAVAEDSRLIRSEVERCRHILQGMSAQGAEFPGEKPIVIAVAEIVHRLRQQLPIAALDRLQIDSAIEETKIVVPVQALLQSLSALVKNAAEAEGGSAPILLRVTAETDTVYFAVKDEGPGIPEQLLRRIGEPFFTTKPPGKGMGLGTFLVRAFAEGLGGSLEFESQPGEGTTATLSIPANSLERVPVAASAH